MCGIHQRAGAGRLYEAVSHDDKELYEVKGANHYYFGQPDKLEDAVSRCADWMRRKGFD